MHTVITEIRGKGKKEGWEGGRDERKEIRMTEER